MNKEAAIALFNEYFLDIVLKKFAAFEGRARRKEFWMFMLIDFLIGVAIGILAMIPFLGFLFNIVSWIFYLAVLIPSIALGVRRLHDTNRGGLLFLLILIPLAGIIILIVFWAQEGTAGENNFGAEPKQETKKSEQKTESVEKQGICGKCGAKNKKGAKFCNECGKPLM
jgi:uncharacterized membrane protein YhaH (DUF805 family)/ribosomal protein L40E